jgi:hypothetical protein
LIAAASQSDTAVAALPQRSIMPSAEPTLPSAELAEASVPAAASVEAPVTVATVEPQVPSLTKNEVVAKSFAALPAQLQKPTLATGPKTAEVRSAMGKRLVKVIAVHPDGTPVGASSFSQAYAELGNAPDDRETPATLAAERVGAGELPSPMSAPKSLRAKTVGSKLATAEPKSDKVASTGTPASTRVIRSSVNVRSKAKSGSKVMFAMPAGTKVTVSDSQSGWLHVTDPRGRSGWVYQSFVSKG